MDLSDPHASATEKLTWAEALLPDLPPRPFRADRAASELSRLHSRISSQADWLRLASESSEFVSAEQLGERRVALAKTLREAAAGAEAVGGRILGFAEKTPADEQAGARLKAVAAALAQQVRDPLTEALGQTAGLTVDRLGAQAAELLERLAAAQAALSESTEALAPLTAEVDAAWLRSLSEPHRRAVDEVAGKSRRAIARAILLDARADGPAPLAVLQDKYAVRIYRFASRAKQIAADTWPEPAADGPRNPERQSTDLEANR